MNRLISGFFFLIATLLSPALMGQELKCGTATPFHDQIVQHAYRSGDEQPLTMLVKVHMIRTDEGETPFGDGWMYNAIEAINADLEEIGVVLKPCGPMNIIDNSLLSWSSIGPFNEFAAEQDVPGYLNIYLKQFTGMSAVGAYSQFPGGYDHMVFGTGGTTMAIAIHEIGHFLSLRHTHEGYNVPGSAEFVDGSNCDTAGDRICDTPASPDLSLSGLVDLDCNYTGDLTDPLGVPYEPSTDNHMSYASNQCRDNFTPGQYNRMAGSRDALRFYMVQGDGSPGIYGVSTKYCISDSSSVFPEPQPAGGTMLINGEPADAFVPSELGPGTHTLTYIPPAGSLNNSSPNKYTSLLPMWTDFSTRSAFWQGIKSTDSGKPTELALRLEAESGTTVNLAIFEDIGIGGALIWEQSLETEGSASMRWHHFELDTAFTPYLIADSSYTLAVEFNGDTLGVNTSNPYVGYDDMPSDNNFARYPHALRMSEGTCDCALDTVEINFAVVNPVLIDTPDLFSEYCTEDTNTVTIETTNPYYAGTFLLDGVPAEGFIPADLSPGSHTATFIPHPGYNVGCTLPGETTFEVSPPPELDLPDTLCVTDEPILLESLGLGGGFLLYDLPVYQIEPDILGPGNHLLVHTYFNPLDTAFWQDTQHFGSGMLTNTLLDSGDVAWQSFVPDSTGRLEKLELYISNYVDSAVVEIKLYQGEGIDGNLMLSQFDTLYPDDPSFDPYFLEEVPWMYHDSVYTVQVLHQGGHTPSWVRKENGAYEPGISNYQEVDGSDFVFSLKLMDFYTCGFMDTHPFTVENCAVGGQEIHQEPGFTVYPNPSNGHVKVELNAGGLGGSLQLFDATGRQLRSWRTTGKRTEIDLGNFETGWYIIALTNEQVMTSKPLLLR